LSDRVQFKMRVIPKPEEGTRTVFQWKEGTPEKTRRGPMMKGRGLSDYKCGNCGHVILYGVNLNQVKDIVFPCENCGKYNEAVLY